MIKGNMDQVFRTQVVKLSKNRGSGSGQQPEPPLELIKEVPTTSHPHDDATSNTNPSLAATVDTKAGGEGDAEHEARLQHHHKFLHPCYSKALKDDTKVQLWSVINLVVAFVYTVILVYHVLIGYKVVGLTHTYGMIFNWSHGVECVEEIKKTSVTLNLCVELVYFAISIMLCVAVFCKHNTDKKVHLCVWFMHLSGIPAFGALSWIPIGIPCSYNCRNQVPSGTIAVYWVVNLLLFIITAAWVFYMHSIAHLYIHWLKTPVPPSSQSGDENPPSKAKMVLNNLEAVMNPIATGSHSASPAGKDDMVEIPLN